MSAYMSRGDYDTIAKRFATVNGEEYPHRWRDLNQFLPTAALQDGWTLFSVEVDIPDGMGMNAASYINEGVAPIGINAIMVPDYFVILLDPEKNQVELWTGTAPNLIQIFQRIARWQDEHAAPALKGGCAHRR